MNIKVNGDVLVITSKINFEQLKKAAKANPVYLSDEHGKKVYGVTVGPVANLTVAGASFVYATSTGNAAMNLLIEPSLNAEEAKEIVLDSLGAPLAALAANEDAINAAIQTITDDREALSNMITIE